jgi:hypothetical protein
MERNATSKTLARSCSPSSTSYFLLSTLLFYFLLYPFSRLHPQPRDRGQLSLVLIECEKIRSSQGKR